jgi:hypothetical protein
MRSVRSIVFVVGTILAWDVGAQTASAAPPNQPLHVVKDCSEFAGLIPSFCTVRSSSLDALGADTVVWYNGPVVASTYFMSSHVLLDAHDGSTASGYCMFDYSKSTAFSTESIGMCSFWGGTGTLAGFNAMVGVTVDASGLWMWDGTYAFSEDAKDPPPTIGGSETVHFTRDARRWL